MAYDPTNPTSKYLSSFIPKGPEPEEGAVNPTASVVPEASPIVEAQPIPNELSWGNRLSPISDPIADKKQSLAERTNQKKSELSGISDYEAAAIATENQNDRFNQDQYLKDIQELPEYLVLRKYGDQGLRDRSNLGITRAEISTARADDRTTGQIVGDTGAGVAKGLATGLGSLASLGAAVINKDAGIWTAEKTGELGEYVDSFKSDELRKRNELYGIEDQLDSQDVDNRSQYDGDGMESTLRRVGRQFFEQGKNLVQNPERLLDVTAEGVGSLVGSAGIGGKLAKGLGMAAGSNSAKWVTGAVLGGMEGGDAYGNAVGQVMDISISDLNRDSELFRSLVQRGMDPEEAKRTVADRAGKIAASIAVPAGAIAGRVVGKFETNPLGRGQGLARTAITQGVEEAFQEGSSQASANVGVRVADPDKDIASGLGEAGALGAAGGVGMAGAVRAPSGALRIGNTVVSGTYNATREALRRGDASARVKNVGQAVDAASQAIPDVIQTVESAEIEQVAVPEQDAELVKDSSRIVDQDSFRSVMESLVATTDQDLADLDPRLHGQVLDENGNRLNKAHGLFALLSDFENPEQNKEVKDLIGVYLLSKIQENNDIFTPENEKFITEQNNPQLSDFFATQKQIVQHVVNAQSLSQFKKDVAAGNVTIPENASPSFLAQIASISPTSLNNSQLTGVLDMAMSGDYPARPKLIKRLQAAKAALDAQDQILEQRAQAMKNRKMSEGKAKERLTQLSDAFKDVRNQINFGANKNNQLPSIAGYSKTISDAMDKGDFEAARSSMRLLRGFAKTMQNKKAAVEQSRQNGGKVRFARQLKADKWIPETDEKYAGSVIIHPNSTASQMFGDEIGIDADAVIAFHDKLVGLYPQISEEGVLENQQENQPVQETNLEPVGESNPDEAVDYITGTESTGSNIRTDVDPDNLIDTEDDFVAPAPSDVTEKVTDQVLKDEEIERTEKAERRKEQQVIADEKIEQAEKKARNADSTIQTTDAETVSEEAENVVSQTDEEAKKEWEDLVNFTNQTREDAPKPDEVFPLLVHPAEGKPHFTASHDFRTERSDFLNMVRVTNDLFSVVKARVLKDVTGPANDMLTSLVDNVAPDIAQWMDEYLITQIDKKDGLLRKRLDAGNTDVLSYRRTITLNFLERNEDGEYQMNPLINQIASLATVQWLLDTRTPIDQDMAEADVASLLGIEESLVTSSTVNAMKVGMGRSRAANELAQVINDLMGISPKKDVSTTYAGGATLALANDIISMLVNRADEESFLVREEIVDIPGSEKTFSKLMFNDMGENPAMMHIRDDLGTENIKAIHKAFVPEVEPDTFIGTAPTEVATTQLRNKTIELSAAEKETIKQNQNTPYMLNQPLLSVMEALGQEVWQGLLGYTDIGETTRNKNHEESLIGKNVSLNTGWVRSFEYVKGIRKYAQDNKMDLGKVPTFFKFDITKVGRLQATGTNPQNDKIMRELLSPTVVTLDLNDKEQNDLFWLTIAQSFDISVEKMPRAEAIQKARDKAEEMSEFVKTFSSLVQGNALSETEGREFQRSLLATGEPITAKYLHALMAVARMQSEPQSSSFEHFLSFEADGKTDGPINAMMNFMTGNFDETQIERFASGGVFFGTDYKTLNDFFNKSKENVDLYQKVADSLSGQFRAIQNFINAGNLLETKQVTENHMALMNLMRSLDMVTENSEGGLVINRGTTKNPLTVTIYGSGVKGISSKIANEIMDTIYERVSDLIALRDTNDQANLGDVDEKLAHVHRDLMPLITNEMKVFKGKRYTKNNPGPDRDMSDLQKFTISGPQFTNLVSNVQYLFATPMVASIQEVVGANTTQTMRLFEKVTQVQSILSQRKYETEVRKEIQQNRDGKVLRSQEDLPQRDYDNLLFSAMSISPHVEMEKQTLNMGLGERFISPTKDGHRDLGDSKVVSLAQVRPSLAGVKASPYITIATGDGKMVLNIYSSEGTIEKTIPIFDGIEMGALNIEEYSKHINKATVTSWQEHTTDALVDSYQNTASGANSVVPYLTDEDYAQLTRIKDGNEPVDMYNVYEFIDELGSKLKQTNNSIKARKAVLEKTTYTSDHMAGGESPYTQEGEGQGLEYMQAQYEIELAKITKEEPENAVEKSPRALMRKIGAEPIQFNLKNLTQLIMNTGEPSQTQRQLIRLVRRNIDPAYSFFLGSNKKNLQKVRNDRNPNMKKGTRMGEGQIDFATKSVYLSNATPETLLHEMLHAATTQTLFDALMDPDNANKEQVAAVRRLKVLRDQFMDLDLSSEPKAVREAASIARAAINEHMYSGESDSEVSALSEFISWTLANQQLAKKLSQTKVQSKLALVAYNAMRRIRNLFGLSPTPVGKDILSNVRFNAEILMMSDAEAGSLNKTTDYTKLLNQDNRLDRLMSEYSTKIDAFTSQRIQNVAPTLKSQLDSKRSLRSLMAAGFLMTPQEQSAFLLIEQAMMLEVGSDSKALLKAQEIYSHILKDLKVETFMADPTSNDPNDRAIAQDKFNALVGRNAYRKDSSGRSGLLSSFVALSQTSKEMREILNEIALPKATDAESSVLANNAMDEFLTEKFNRMSVRLGDLIKVGVKQPKSTVDMLDQLSMTMATVQSDARFELEKQAVNKFGEFEDKINSTVDKAVETIYDTAEAGANKSSNALSSSLFKIVQGFSGIASKKHNEAIAASATHFLNVGNTPKVVREFFAEIRGETEDNTKVVSMINKVKSSIAAARQDYREVLPEFLSKQFKERPDREMWEKLSSVLAPTDVGALGSFSLNNIAKLYSDRGYLDAQVQERQKVLTDALPKQASRKMSHKAYTLAHYMMTGEVTSSNMNRNAYAISRLLGEPISRDLRKKLDDGLSDELVKTVDELTSLYAIQMLKEDSNVKAVRTLFEKDKDGMNVLVRYLASLHEGEIKKTTNPRALLNHYKGRMDNVRSDGAHLVVELNSKTDELERRGYVQVAPYKGASNETFSQSRSYFLAPMSTRATYNQGVMQTVQRSMYGVDLTTGFTLGSQVAGLVYGQKAKKIAEITASMEDLPPSEYLLPLYDEKGNIFAYERSMDPKMLAKVSHDKNLATRMGAWRGRQEEEGMSVQYNKELIHALQDTWEDRMFGSDDEFIDVLDTDELDKDPVLRDAVKVIPKEIITYAKKHMPQGFMIRKDMINDALGYRSASIGDVFTGDTRMSPLFTDTVEKVSSAIMGKKAFSVLVRGEQLTQSVISAAKQTIVIKSVMVGYANIVANVFQLMMRNVPVRDIVKGSATKTMETNQYLRHKTRRAEIEAEIAALGSNPILKRRLEAERASLDDADRRMTIWPLVEAGLFSSISDGLTETDVAFEGNNMMDNLERQLDRLPAGLQTAAKYAVVARDTAMYRLLNRTIQYGDFVAKSLFYDDLISKGVDPERAMRLTRDEFVNYDRLPGRTRTFLEGIGALWFWNFKIRSLKVGANMIRDNPFKALMWSLFPPTEPVDGRVGSPMDDNILSVWMDDRLGYSVGPQMSKGIITMNPWVSLAT